MTQMALPHPLPTSRWRAGIDGDALDLALPPWRGFDAGVWVEAMAWHESRGDPGAIHIDKPGWLTTSYGLFQIEGSTAARLIPGLSGPEPLFRPVFNRALALALLCELGHQYCPAPHSMTPEQMTVGMDRVIAAYNGGSWGAEIPLGRGTVNDQAYVNKILQACAEVKADRG